MEPEKPSAFLIYLGEYPNDKGIYNFPYSCLKFSKFYHILKSLFIGIHVADNTYNTNSKIEIVKLRKFVEALIKFRKISTCCFNNTWIN